MKSINLDDSTVNLKVNTNADKIAVNETVKAGLWLGAGIWALTKCLKHAVESGKNVGMCEMIDIINNDLDDHD